ncbi:hypothetical protein Rhe02_58820 [Rhizocola hellebori]|uniref:Glycosyltransferase n=1 Tax=Rhizocola hellebori TaxID=1392758 RepID=A0A8J3QBY3_9ACTN|nr:glycosyltransferase [Rhizocola hellebori]GIH07815.1 hypothetical protein Rhe02_58820 [Rhizocola hellebori]
MSEPLVSVVIPTYNRADELRETLTSLTAQRLAAQHFEVVVADDGSSDSTAEMARSFESRLALRYHYQEDRGARAALARNSGARLATAEVLAFLDAGTIAGPDFVQGHLDQHAEGGPPRVVIGYTYGYRPFDPTPGLAQNVAALSADEVRALYGDDPSFQDTRHRQFAMVDFDVHALPLPWIMSWTVNLSVRAEQFWRVGGFDEDFTGWGAEDLDLGLRLYKAGTRFVLGRAAWAIESPHERDPSGKSDQVTRNAMRMLTKFPEPATELNWAWFATGEWLVQQDSLALHERYAELLAWTEQTRDLHADATIDKAARDLPQGSSVAVFGCGASLPAWMPGALSRCALFDFDPAAVAEAEKRLPGQTHHGLGVRTALPDRSVDLVVLTPRLRGIWRSYGKAILAEAERVGRNVSDLSQG